MVWQTLSSSVSQGGSTKMWATVLTAIAAPAPLATAHTRTHQSLGTGQLCSSYWHGYGFHLYQVGYKQDTDTALLQRLYRGGFHSVQRQSGCVSRAHTSGCRLGVSDASRAEAAVPLTPFKPSEAAYQRHTVPSIVGCHCQHTTSAR